MSLSTREEQILGSIEGGLALSDPNLASMMATFTRLASGEEMPVREKIHAVRLVANLRDRRPHRRNVVRRSARGLYKRLGLPQYWVLWLAAVAAVALVAITLAISRGGSGSRSGRGSCATSWSATVCTAQVPAHPSGSEAHQAASDQSSRAGVRPAAGRASNNRPTPLSLRAGQINSVVMSAAFRMPANVR